MTDTTASLEAPLALVEPEDVPAPTETEALATIDELTKDDGRLLRHVTATGQRLRSQLAQLQSEYPSLVAEVRDGENHLRVGGAVVSGLFNGAPKISFRLLVVSNFILASSGIQQDAIHACAGGRGATGSGGAITRTSVAGSRAAR